MRVIKFRAWNKESQQMTEIFDLRDIAVTDGVHIVDTDSPIMQFTGFKDRDGVEIYEGDFLSDYTGWNNKLTPVDFSMKHTGHATHLCNGFEIHTTKCKVVGNIYQNPELRDVSVGFDETGSKNG